MAPSRYPNQCWNNVKWTLRNKFQWNFYQNSYISFKKMHLKMSDKRQPFCLDLKVLNNVWCVMWSIFRSHILNNGCCVKSHMTERYFLWWFFLYICYSDIKITIHIFYFIFICQTAFCHTGKARNCCQNKIALVIIIIFQINFHKNCFMLGILWERDISYSFFQHIFLMNFLQIHSLLLFSCSCTLFSLLMEAFISTKLTVFITSKDIKAIMNTTFLQWH